LAKPASGGQGGWLHGGAPGLQVGFATFDVFPGAFRHGGAGAADVEHQVAAIADQLQAIGKAVANFDGVADHDRMRVRRKVGESFGGGDEHGPEIENVGIGAQRFGLDLGGVGEIDNRRCNICEGRNLGEIADHRLRDFVDVSHALANLDVAAFVKILDRNREGAERFAPKFVDAFFATAMQYEAAEFHRFQQAIAAFTHQGIVAADFDAIALQFNQFTEDVGRPVEERPGQHGGLDATPAAVGFFGVGLAGFGQTGAGNIQPVLGVIEQSSGQGFDQPLFGVERVCRDGVGFDPEAIVENAFLTRDHPASAFWWRIFGMGGDFQAVYGIHGLRHLSSANVKTQAKVVLCN
jgi:hypothetical protein